jgi:hypothetical protein
MPPLVPVSASRAQSPPRHKKNAQGKPGAFLEHLFRPSTKTAMKAFELATIEEKGDVTI